MGAIESTAADAPDCTGPGDDSVDLFADVEFEEGTMVERTGKVQGKFTVEQFDAKRSGLQEGPVLASLAKAATDLRLTRPEALSPLPKSCFIICNSYTKPNLRLGPGPISDSLVVAQNHAKRGFKCYFLYNPTPAQVMSFLPVFFQKTKTALTVFFTGHGASVPDLNGDESDGFDEAMVFDEGHILDDDLREVLVQNFNGKAKVILLSDCCHSGSIWDLQSKRLKGQKKIPSNVMSIGAAQDSETAKQMTVSGQAQGIFSFYFWQAINSDPKMSPKKLAATVNKQMERFNQKAVIFASSWGIGRHPIFE
jgi:hypothetical protein